MVLDGGIIKTKTFKQRPLYYIFDQLLMNNEKVRTTYQERYNFLTEIELTRGFNIPENTSSVKSEYESLLSETPADLDWKWLEIYETFDATTSVQDLACVAGSCEISDFGTVKAV